MPEPTINEAVVYQVNLPYFSNPLEKSGIGNGYCTDLVRYYRPDIPFKGNAKTWYAQAVRLGYETGTEPKPDAIYWSGKGRYGHVAYVIDMDEDSFTLIEQNVRGRYIISKRSLPRNGNYLFIY